MKDIYESDVFEFLDKGVNIKEILVENFKSNGRVDCKDLLEDEFKKIGKIYKDELSKRALIAVSKGDIIVFYNDKTTKRIPVWFPFFKIKSNGVSKTVVDVTNYVQIRKDKDTGDTEVNVAYKKLYCLIVSAYIFSKCEKHTVLTPTLMKYTANVWAKMFCKILSMKVGLQSNKERHDAFMYFAMRFYLQYVLEAPVAVAEQIAKSTQFNGVLNSTAASIEQACADREIDLYSNFTVFCTTLFNNDITGIRGMRINSGDNITYAYYIRQFIQMYYPPITLSLVSFPHFIWAVFSANNFAYLMNDKLLESISVDEYPKIIAELTRMVSMS